MGKKTNKKTLNRKNITRYSNCPSNELNYSYNIESFHPVGKDLIPSDDQLFYDAYGNTIESFDPLFQKILEEFTEDSKTYLDEYKKKVRETNKKMKKMILKKMKKEPEGFIYNADGTMNREKTIEHFCCGAGRFVDSLKNAGRRAADGIKRGYENAKRNLVNQGNALYNRVVAAARRTYDSIKRAGEAIKRAAEKAAKSIASAAVKFYDKALKGAMNKFKGAMTKIANQVKNGAMGAFNGAMKGLKSAGSFAKKGFNAVKGAAKKSMGAIKGGFNKTIGAIQKGATSAFDAVKKGTMGAFDAIADGVTAAFNAAAKGLNGALNVVKNVPKMLPLPRSSPRKNKKTKLKKIEEKKPDLVSDIPGTNVSSDSIKSAASKSGLNPNPEGFGNIGYITAERNRISQLYVTIYLMILILFICYYLINCGKSV